MLERPAPERAGPGQESVWDYPRPPAVEPSDEHVQVWFADHLVADTRRAVRVLETAHAPVYYLPRADVRTDLFELSDQRTICEFKGVASYADLVVGDQRVADACWWYADPVPGYEVLKGSVAFYPRRVDRCLVDDEVVRPVAGDFYGAWVTSRVVGPFKGGIGTFGW